MKGARTIGKYVLLHLVNIMLGAVSQMLLKKAANNTYNSQLKEYMNIWVIGAYLLFGVTTIISVKVYSTLPLNVGLVLESTSYIYVMLFGTLLFKEKLNCRKWFAVFLIIVGIIVYVGV